MITMKYLGPSQVERIFEEKTLDEKLVIYKKAFGIKEMYPEFTRIDCIASSLGYKKCISGSGFYENENN